MSQNQEIIEAKLCAYIDGEIDSEGRAEIEKHLEANPQHRRLLESLRATRDLLKWLPREPAPSEVAETLNGQLERSVLLDYDGRSMPTNFWPRAMAAAAIIVLTAGLAAAVYFALPRSQKSATPFAMARTEATRSGGASTVTAPQVDQAGAESESRESLARRELPVESKALGREERAADSIAEPSSLARQKTDLDKLALAVAANSDAFDFTSNATTNSLNKLKSPPPILSNAAVMLVRSDTPQIAVREVTGYLDAQQIPWKQASAAASTPSVAQALDTAQNQNRAASAIDEQQEIRQRAGLEDQTRQAQRSGNSEKEATARGIAAPARKAGLSTTRPAEPPAQADQAAQNEVAARVDNLPDKSAATNVAYVARMYRRQALELTNSLMRDRSQTAELKDTDGSVQSGPEAASPMVNQAIGGFGGRGLSAGLAGRTDAETALAARLGAQAPATQPLPGVPHAAATTQPAIPAANGPVPQLREALKDSQLLAPATQPQVPLPPATVPSDQPIDVVIFIQANSPPPTTQPATQPSALSQIERFFLVRRTDDLRPAIVGVPTTQPSNPFRDSEQ